MQAFGHLRELAAESLVYGLSGVLSRSLAIFLVPVYARVFSPEDYGVMGLVTTTMALVSILVVLALDTAAHRWFWDTEDIDDRKITLASWTWCQITVSLAIAILIFALSGWLGEVIVRRADAKVYFRLAAIAVPLSVLGTVVTNWLRMQRRPWATMSFSLGTGLFNILLTVLFVVILHWGLEGVYIAQVVTAGLGTTVAGILLEGWVLPKGFQWKRLKAMMRYSVILIPAAIAYWIVNQSGGYFVQSFTSTSEVGLFHVGATLASVVTLGTGAFQQAWGPFAFSIHKQPEGKQVYASALLAYLWVASLLSTSLALFAPELLRLFTTEAYMGAHRVVGLLAFSHVMIGLSYIAIVGPSIVKTTKPLGVAVVAVAGLNILLNFLLVPRFGKEGSALATLLAQCLVPIYVFYCSQKLYPIPYRFGTAVKIILFSLMVAFVGGKIQINHFFLGIAIKVVLVGLFIPALFLLRVISVEQARHLLTKERMRLSI